MFAIDEWLRDNGLERFSALFKDNEIDGEVLFDLTDDDLKELGLSLGARKKVRRAIDAFRAGGSGACETGPARGAAPSDRSTGAERRHLTIMFVDLVNSTGLSGELDPEDMREVITRYQNAVAGVITRFQGQVAKYMGDGVLSYFGWPRAHEDDPERAVRSGLEIIATLGQIAAPGHRRLSARIGIATGLVVVGDLIGEGAAEEQAVVGETPNLAARLQAAAEPNTIVISGSTHQLLGDVFTTADLGALDLKGINGPTPAFKVLKERPAESRFESRISGPLLPMVGRDHELGLILERWARATSGEGQVVLLTGEAGIGKSRLTRSVVEAIEAGSHIRLSYQCSPYHSDSSFYPIIQQMTFAAGLQPDDRPEEKLDKLEAMLKAAEPSIVSALLQIDGAGRYGPLNPTPQQLRNRTLEALSKELVALAKVKPVLFVLEDAHWIDASTLEWLDFCLDGMTRERVLMLITARPTFEHGFGGHPVVSRLALNRLGTDQVTAIVSKITGGKKLPPGLVEQIAARTDGVPLFIEELTKTIIESGDLRETETSFELTGPLSRISIPATLHDSLMARIDRLQPVKEVAQMAACIGRQFDHSVLARVSGLDASALREALDRLVAAELIFRRGLAPQASYVFKHALVRDVAYESLLRKRRHSIHARLVEVFQTDSNAAPELVAHHATEAGLNETAIDLWEKAGTMAFARPAYVEAINHLRFAIHLIGTLENRAAWRHRELALLVQLAQVFVAKYGYSSIEASETFAQATEMLDGSEDTSLRVAALYGTWIGPYIGAKHNRALELAGRLVDDVDKQAQPIPRLIAHRMRSATLIAMGRPAAALRDLDIAYSLYQEAKIENFASRFAQDPGVQIWCYQLLALWLSGFPDQALALSAKAMERARDLSHANTLCYAGLHSVVLSLWARNPIEARSINGELSTVANEHDMALWKLYGAVHGALLDCLDGDAQAPERLDKVLIDYQERRCGLWLTLYRAEQAKALLRMGSPARAAETVRRAIAAMEPGGERWAESELYRIDGEIRLVDGDVDAALEAFRTAIDVARGQEARSLELRAATSLARLMMARCRPREAREMLGPILGWFKEGYETHDLRDARSVLDALQ